uniref:AAA+ ATPase domain-containing protein n=1 Tax=Photinus pyralis TaxID=7054 RepID=A0A1Y1MJJ3_PHOPY
MTSPKNKKGSTSWFLCEKCNCSVTQSDKERHFADCPPDLTTSRTHNFVLGATLYGTVDLKPTEEIKGLTPQDYNNLVFLSQSAIQLCELCIGEHALVYDDNQAYALRVWPTVEKTLTSVLLTKRGLDRTFDINTLVRVKRFDHNVTAARQVILKPLAHCNIELTHDVNVRIHKAYLRHFLTKGNKITIFYFGVFLTFEVIDITQPDKDLVQALQGASLEPQFFQVVDSTSWNIFRSELEYKQKKERSLLEIGGLDKEIGEIKDIIHIALGKTKAVSQSLISHGALLYGSPGAGKTMVVNALANNIDAHVVKITDGDDLEVTFNEAMKRTPSLIIIDDIDTLCPLRTSRIGDLEKKFTSSLLGFFEQINSESAKAFVIATSNKPDAIDLSVRRCGRFDHEIEIPTPNQSARYDILSKLLRNIPQNMGDDELRDIANVTHGFVGSDLVLLCAQAALRAATLKSNKLCAEHFRFALTRVNPSAMREVQIEVPNVKWSDIGGQADLKLILRQAVEWPIKHPESFVRLGITPPRGVLMFGPPGCSKTMIAKALATESGLNFLSIKGPELFSKWVGESERAVREVFRKARQVAPSVIFFDEIDALGGERSSGSSTSVQERVLAQLLTELDGVTPLGDVTVLAATNRPDKIDKALLRPGRLDRIVYVPLPDSDTRREIFKLKVSKMPVVDVDYEALVSLTEGYSGAEVNAVCHEAAMNALEESLDAQSVEMRHFVRALQLVTPRTPVALLTIYKNYLK